MTIRDIHIGIEQGLQTIGVFAYSDMEHDEVDIAINAVINKEIRNIFRDIDKTQSANNFESNQYYTDFIKSLKVKTTIVPTKHDIYYSVDLPIDYRHLVSDVSKVIAKNCKGAILKENDSLKIGDVYKAVDNTLHNGIWYKKCETFIATNTEWYGEKVEHVPTQFRYNRLTPTENLQTVLNSALGKTQQKSPVSELVNNQLLIYYSNFEIAAVTLDYIKKPQIVNYQMNVGTGLSDGVDYYIIEKTIQHLTIRLEGNQQKLVNLKSENIENT